MRTCPVMWLFRRVTPLIIYRGYGGWCFCVRWPKTVHFGPHSFTSTWRVWIWKNKPNPLDGTRLWENS